MKELNLFNYLFIILYVIILSTKFTLADVSYAVYSTDDSFNSGGAFSYISRKDNNVITINRMYNEIKPYPHKGSEIESVSVFVEESFKENGIMVRKIVFKANNLSLDNFTVNYPLKNIVHRVIFEFKVTKLCDTCNKPTNEKRLAVCKSNIVEVCQKCKNLLDAGKDIANYKK